MPLIKSEDSTPLVDFKCKIREDELQELRLYALAISSSENNVISQAIKRLTADKEFQTWKEKNQATLTPAAPLVGAKRGPKAKQQGA